MRTAFYRKLSNPLGLAVLDLIPYEENGFYITRINVPDAHRRKGLGNELLDECLAEADKAGVVLVLEIQPYGPMSVKNLRAWYRRKGFKGRRGGHFGQMWRKPSDKLA